MTANQRKAPSILDRQDWENRGAPKDVTLASGFLLSFDKNADIISHYRINWIVDNKTEVRSTVNGEA